MSTLATPDIVCTWTSRPGYPELTNFTSYNIPSLLLRPSRLTINTGYNYNHSQR